MARAGRKPQGRRLIEDLRVDALGKARLIAFLETMSGDRTVEEACQELGIGQSRFFEMRGRWLYEAVQLLAPKRIGRPPHEQVTDPRIGALEQELRDLKQQLLAAELRAKLAELREAPGDGAGQESKKKRLPR